MFPDFISKNIIFSLLIITLQFSLMLSEEEKCYSIKNCLSCPELDYCEKCETGFLLNKPKTKCNGKGSGKVLSRAQLSYKAQTPTKNENPFLNKPVISVNKAQNNPFQNVPISSFQKFKDKDANNEIINKILIFILIILVLSIVASVIYNFVKKRMSNGYGLDDGQEESAKVVYIR